MGLKTQKKLLLFLTLATTLFDITEADADILVMIKPANNAVKNMNIRTTIKLAVKNA